MVDAIVRKAYGEIHAGNTDDAKKLVDEYMASYKEYTFKGTEAEIDEITGGDVMEEIRPLQEIASGLDQWDRLT